MKKIYLVILILLFIILFCLSGCEINTKNNESSNNVEISRTDLELNTTDSITNDISTNNHSDNSEDSSNDDSQKNESSSPPTQTELATFSTTIIDKRENRQNNIRITCSKLNDLTIDSFQTFSFLKTIGETTAEARI